jgi:hypothetical protein
MAGGVEPTLDEVVRIAAAFGISTLAALYRLNTLRAGGLLTSSWRQRSTGRPRRSLGAAQTEPVADAIAAIDAGDLPWLSPALHESALAGIARGSTSTRVAAESIGCDEVPVPTGAEKARKGPRERLGRSGVLR